VFGSTPLGVAYNGSRWVATANKGGGNTNTIACSDDGITWTGATNSWTIFSGACYNVAWGTDKWVAVGYGGNRIAYSTDGITWTGSTSGNSRITGTGYGISHNGSQWVAAGKSQQDVGDILGISTRTVEVHLRSAREKLGALTTVQAVGRAIGLNIIYPR
jgi:hypothetical protein